MNILFLTLLDINDLGDNGIYHDFINEVKRKGHNISVVSAKENIKSKSYIINSNGIDILKVSVGKITKTSYLQKGINTLLIERKYEKAIKKHFYKKSFDLIIYTTPPITFNKLVKKLKKSHNAKTYLMLKDIFPQNAVDLNILKKYNPITIFFRNKEKKLYQLSDYIGVMSPENERFIRNNNPIKSKVQIFRNALYEIDYSISDIEKLELTEKYNIDFNKTIFLYGGNLGLPQSPAFIKNVIENFSDVYNSQFIIVGNGTHFDYLKDVIHKVNNPCVKIFNSIPRNEYNKLISACDIGVIFLDDKFTIPNYPSRLTSLLNASKPIILATDEATDIGKEVVSNNAGLWSRSNDINSFIENANKLANEYNYLTFSENAYNLFIKEFTIEENVLKLLKLVGDRNEEKR